MVIEVSRLTKRKILLFHCFLPKVIDIIVSTDMCILKRFTHKEYIYFDLSDAINCKNYYKAVCNNRLQFNIITSTLYHAHFIDISRTLGAFLIGWLGLIQSELDRLDWIRLSYGKKERLNQFRSLYVDVISQT